MVRTRHIGLFCGTLLAGAFAPTPEAVAAGAASRSGCRGPGCASALLAVAASAQAARTADLPAGEYIGAIEEAYYARDPAAATAALEQVPSDDPLTRAWALWRVAVAHPIDEVTRQVKRANEAIRKRLLDEAEPLIESILAGSPSHPQALLVLSQVHQARITGMMSGMRYGRRAGETLERAFASDPESPQVLYHKGINALMAPGPFGDKDQGRRQLREAVQRFDSLAEAGEVPWGQGEVIAARLGVNVKRESDFRETQARVMQGFVAGFGWVTVVLMSGAIGFIVLNTMFGIVRARRREIGVLRALGFGRLAVVIGVMAEAILLAVIGSAVGSAAAWLWFDGVHTSTLNVTALTQLGFSLLVDGETVFRAAAVAVVIGAAGGLPPAVGAARESPASLLRID